MARRLLVTSFLCWSAAASFAWGASAYTAGMTQGQQISLTASGADDNGAFRQSAESYGAAASAYARAADATKQAGQRAAALKDAGDMQAAAADEWYAAARAAHKAGDDLSARSFLDSGDAHRADAASDFGSAASTIGSAPETQGASDEIAQDKQNQSRKLETQRAKTVAALQPASAPDTGPNGAGLPTVTYPGGNAASP